MAIFITPAHVLREYNVCVTDAECTSGKKNLKGLNLFLTVNDISFLNFISMFIESGFIQHRSGCKFVSADTNLSILRK